MSYDIRAGYRYGQPFLQIRDAHSGALRLLWECPRCSDPEDAQARELALEEALHKLFKRLFLLSAAKELTPSASSIPTKLPIGQSSGAGPRARS